MHPYLPHTPEDIKEMLATIGVEHIGELFADIDSSIQLNRELNIPSAYSEIEIINLMKKFIKMNGSNEMLNLAGGGMYQHMIPSAINYLTMRSEFSTAYTPYQPEISQGSLQSIFEYQSMICMLTGMAASNASHYDGSTATAEAVMMAYNLSKRSKVLIANTINPEVLKVVQTYCYFKGIEVTMVPEKNGVVDAEAFKQLISDAYCSYVVQSPNYYGLIEDISNFEPLTHKNKALLIVNMNPIAMAILKTPGEMLADIAVGDGQVLGNPMNFGGPSFGFMATTEKLMRKLPGRIVGKTKDLDGKDGYVLTLQAREQHIRREKATSNITSNQALNALAGTIYMSLLGPSGLKEVAKKSMANIRYLVEKLTSIQGIVALNQGYYFNETVLYIPKAKELYGTLIEQNICIGILLELNDVSKKDQILIATTEIMNKDNLDYIVSKVNEWMEVQK